MAIRVILLSGPVAVGKSSLAKELIRRYQFVLLKTRHLISAALSETDKERTAFQMAGEDLDRRTGGKWVSAALLKEASKLQGNETVLVDSVRIAEQIVEVRNAFGDSVVHVHLTCEEAELARRYGKRSGELEELPSYSTVRENPTEARVGSLEDIADILISTHRSSLDDVVVRVSSHLGLYGRCREPLVDVVVGGEFGSEGKGHICSYIAPEYQWLIRVGGPNAGHTVYQRPHPVTFHQLPSGTLSSDAKIILGPGALLNVDLVLEEIGRFRLPVDRVFIDPQAMIIEKSDLDFERKTLGKTIGSTAQGVGSAMARKVLRAAKQKVRLAKDIPSLNHYIRPTADALDEAFSRGERVLLEGTQGTGLSLHHGDYPYVTSRETSVSGCLAEAGCGPRVDCAALSSSFAAIRSGSSRSRVRRGL